MTTETNDRMIEMCEANGTVVWSGPMSDLREENAHDEEVQDACDCIASGSLMERVGLYLIRVVEAV